MRPVRQSTSLSKSRCSTVNPTAPQGGKKKRNSRGKTFTGCWTCRSRSLKCDEGKPICLRCQKGNHKCEGYGNRLVWIREGEATQRQGLGRRTIFDGSESTTPVFNEEFINAALQALDLLSPGSDLEMGPFRVFSWILSTSGEEAATTALNVDFPLLTSEIPEEIISSNDTEEHEEPQPSDSASQYNPTVSDPPQPQTDLISVYSPILLSAKPGWNIDSLPDVCHDRAESPPTQNDCNYQFDTDLIDPSLSYNVDIIPASGYGSPRGFIEDIPDPPGLELDQSAPSRFWHQERVSQDARLQPIPLRKILLPLVDPYLSSSSIEERQLLHYWVTCMSNLMVITDRPDNPFRDVYIPLALSAPELRSESSGHAALLYSIYALVAFNRAKRENYSDHFLAIGFKNHKSSLKHLRQSLTLREDSQRDAVLATIITMSSIEAVTGASSRWRVHLQGGRDWLRFIERDTREKSKTTSILHQIFLFVEALGYSANDASESQALVSLSAPSLKHNDFEMEENTFTEYTLAELFGLSLPVFDILAETNHLRGISTPPSTRIDALERKLHASNPSTQQFSGPTASCQALTRHHACLFYYSTFIYFHRSLRPTLLSDIQYLVRFSLDHLKAIGELEDEIRVKGTNVSGVLWPVFVAACEAVDESLREELGSWFEMGKVRGIDNIYVAGKVVREVWKRRDDLSAMGIGGEENVRWREVMKDMGLDILLT